MCLKFIGHSHSASVSSLVTVLYKGYGGYLLLGFNSLTLSKAISNMKTIVLRFQYYILTLLIFPHSIGSTRKITNSRKIN